MPPDREAELRLRGRTGALRGRLYWPGSSTVQPTGLLVAFAAAEEGRWWRSLSARAGLIVLTVGCGAGALDDAVEVLGWVAENSPRLGGQAGMLLVGGIGRTAGLAAHVAQEACTAGWPPLRRQVLVCTSPVALVPSAGVAAAVVVTVERDPQGDDGRYARLLRSAGAEVEELRYAAPDPGSVAGIRTSPAVLAQLAAALSADCRLPSGSEYHPGRV
jgi:hypothetical protein